MHRFAVGLACAALIVGVGCSKREDDAAAPAPTATAAPAATTAPAAPATSVPVAASPPPTSPPVAVVDCASTAATAAKLAAEYLHVDSDGAGSVARAAASACEGIPWNSYVKGCVLAAKSWEAARECGFKDVLLEPVKVRHDRDGERAKVAVRVTGLGPERFTGDLCARWLDGDGRAR